MSQGFYACYDEDAHMYADPDAEGVVSFASPEEAYKFLIHTLTGRNLRGAIGNVAQIAAQHPEEHTSRALMGALRQHWICQREGQ